MKKLNGNFSITESGSISYEIFDAGAEKLPEIVALLQTRFGFTQQPLKWGLEGCYLDCILESVEFIIGWDIWSGCFIMPLSRSEEGDRIINEIGAFLR